MSALCLVTVHLYAMTRVQKHRDAMLLMSNVISNIVLHINDTCEIVPHSASLSIILMN